MGGLGLRGAVDHAPAAYATSLLSAQPTINQLLGQIEDEEQPYSLPQHLLDCLSARQGEEVDTESLIGVTEHTVAPHQSP